ncbi:MAG: hypothetical protein LBN95_06650, partial [Prevotellaceae bacterium]|nr:hypothetical protein [Prevotellaceae bacterium]
MLHILSTNKHGGNTNPLCRSNSKHSIFLKNGMFKGVMLLFLAALLLPHSAKAMPGVNGGGDGTEASPYTINNATDWNTFRTNVNASTATYIN